MHFHMHMPEHKVPKAVAKKPKPEKEQDSGVDYKAKCGVGGDAANTICGMHGDIE